MQRAARRARRGRRAADRAAPGVPQPHPARSRARVLGRRPSSPGILAARDAHRATRRRSATTRRLRARHRSSRGTPTTPRPAILGGATARVDATTDGPRATASPVHPDVVPVVLVPAAAPVATRTARGVLPRDRSRTPTPRSQAGPRGAAGRGAGPTARTCCSTRPQDRLHQEYRRAVMPGSLALVDALRAAGSAAVVSGAGPTVLVLARRAADGATDADDAVARRVRRRHGRLADPAAPGGPQRCDGRAGCRDRVKYTPRRSLAAVGRADSDSIDAFPGPRPLVARVVRDRQPVNE